MRIRILIVGASILLSGILYAQQIRLVSGNLDFLDGQSKLMLQYDYEGMAVGKYENESDYIEEIVKNNNEDKPGSGEEWKEGWYSDRDERFHPAFESAINKKLKKKRIVCGPVFKDAKYTILMEVLRTEPGYNYFMAKAIANISLNVFFIESNNPENKLARIIIPLCPGSHGGRIADRIETAYERCGKELGEFLVEKAFVK